MCNFVMYVTKCRQCGRTLSSAPSDYVYCPLYRNQMGCQTIERERRTTLVCCSSCQNAYGLDADGDYDMDRDPQDNPACGSGQRKQ
ncbi:hypothetical protein CMUS01_09445 [Colletotrichum musicola]|uniref:Uncharacterized protein n=1 Tax=Colletotrichum musicola TaxID=2175873 RepID=A0A8H6K8L7_9PEZI|nr:hypothetical protein CMUS01_09445 [Colletotrichum musicola]